ncbi:ubiquinol-cytochrome c reductase iron-sulfur subunit [Coraliomargarita parva]|uniref:QcrA and Rieske domain-containing protein n=1 Tax=Coraliomargarita parva TaxID=3014050 RepID=UPI0022B2FA25|nr:Rieske (2Fe-2S) protein [Coraliomargarita parva]
MNEPVKESETTPKKQSRRQFLTIFVQGGIFATLAGMLIPALVYLWPVTKQGPSGGMREIGRLDDIPVGGAKKIVVDGSALLLLRTTEGVRAFSAICPHLGCLVNWDGKNAQIVCPCHAGIFDTNGQVVSGPPPRGLKAYEVILKDDRIFLKV